MSLVERAAETMKGAYQSVFQRRKVLPVQKRIDSKAIPLATPLFEEGDIIQIGDSKAVYLGRDTNDLYQGSVLFLLDKQFDESPSLVTRRGNLGKKTGRATPEQMDLVKEEIGRIIA